MPISMLNIKGGRTMIQTEMITPKRIRHYSDAGMMLRQIETGHLYEDAVDRFPCKWTYEETNIPIVVEEPGEEPELE